MRTEIMRRPAARLPYGWAAGLVLAVWLPYTVVEALSQAGRLAAPTSLALQIGLGAAAVGALLAAGRSRHDCFLRLAPLSRPGLVVLALSALLTAPALMAGPWAGWGPWAALLAAPASAGTQELYFRGALLPALLLLLPRSPRLALGLHALLFGLWHIGPIVVGAPLWGVLAVLGVPMLCGLAWGWQVQHDQTIVWALLVHTGLLMLASLYIWA